ncbi:MAG TPA: formate/nitrite transporter family protein [Stellaceae bacterium]|jgi:formate/nitrite transporter FocA (FNT family)|nr:formate/nitrite transporter family protein [Stellaceae bacterium]
MDETRTRRSRRQNQKRTAPAKDKDSSEEHGITQQEVKEVEERSSPRTPVIYEIVRRMGDEEMERPVTSLWWSGVAAGLSISFSLLSQAVLQEHLPQQSWTLLVSSLGYSVGFVMVVLARQQLFTENTVTAVLPVVAEFSGANFWRLSRLWSVVLVANLVGTLFAAAFASFTPVLTPEIYGAMLEISRHLLGQGWWALAFKGVGAGFLIATMVWLLPSAATAQLFVVILMTWLIAAGEFAHIIAGSVEAFLLAINGDASWGWAIGGFIVPVLIGNIVGGTALFALLSYAQVMNEI